MEPKVDLHMTIGPRDEWTAVMTWYTDDRHGPGKLEIRPTDPDNPPAAGLSQTVLREVDFAAAVDEMRELDKYVANVPKINWETIGDELTDMSASGITDGYLAMLSIVYSASAASTPKPLDYLAKVTGKSAAAIKNHLWQATRKGLLERSPGRAGGRVTPKAIDLLGKYASET